MKTYSHLKLIVLIVALLFALPSYAQTAATPAMPSNESLSTLPDSEMIVYLNASRIIRDAMPRLVPQKELQQIRDGMVQIKGFINVDLNNLEYVVLAIRFNKPAGTTLYPIPDAMVVIRGDFDAKALIGMATMMSDGKLREEKFGDHSLYALKVSEFMGKSTSNPFSSAFSEIAITNLDSSTLAIGTTAYIKAALEAVDGRGRIKSQTVASVLRDPNVLISATGAPLTAFAKSLGLRMAENPDPNCMTRFGEYYLSLAMISEAFKVNGAINADNPATANMIKNMLMGFIQEGKGLVPDKNAQTMLSQLKLVAEGDEVLVEATIPMEMAVKFVGDIFKPVPPKAVTTETKKETTTPAGEQKPGKPKPKNTKSKSRT